MRRMITKGWAAIALVLVAAALVSDQVRRSAASAPPRRAETPTEAPPGARDPAAAAIHPTGEAWAAYLRRAPLSVGTMAPSLTAKARDGKTLHLPQKDLPSVWMVLCGCQDCRKAGYRGWELSRRLDNKAHFDYFVSNTTEYVWERMTMSFGQATDLVWDRNGDYYSILRPPGTRYSHLPMVWGLDRSGRIQYFSRPAAADDRWVADLCRRLGLKPALQML